MLDFAVGNNIEKRDVPYVTIALMVANIVVYLHQVSQFGQAESRQAAIQGEIDFYEQFGLIPTELAEFQVLGLITYMFVHAGAMHLIGNMLMLWVFGPAIEAGLGRWTMLGFYGVFGLLGGLAHAGADFGSAIPLVGASGAIAGLIGAFTILYGPASKIRMMACVFFHFFFFKIPAAAFGVGWIILQVAHASQDACAGGVAWWAHIGGFLAGVAVAWVCKGDQIGELVEGSDETVRMLSPEEIEAQRVLEEQIKSRKENGLSAIVVPLQESELAAPPTACEHCDAELEEKDKIGDQLYRCSGCQRMVYLSVQQAESMAMAHS